MKAIGIDFGTTNSVAAGYANGSTEVIPIDNPPAEWATLGFDTVLPSVVAMDADRNLLFGWAAKVADTDRKFEAIKRLFLEEETVSAGGETFFVEEVAAALFAHIRRSVIGQGIDFRSAVITVPANSRGLARYRTKVCSGMGGIEPLALINEPTAAAMAYGIDASHDQTLMVFDWGGGTLDVTVLETVAGAFIEQASAGKPKLGGLDFDYAIMQEIANEVPDSRTWTSTEKALLRLDVERAKILLSDQDETVIINDVVPGGYRLTRPKFNDLTRHLLERAAEPIDRCFSDLRYGPGDIDHVLLVGGTSKSPAVRNLVAELTGKEGAVGVDPLTAVGQGAAIAAAILSGENTTNDFFVSTEHALGAVVVDVQKRDFVFVPIIPRNWKLPARETDVFSPIFDDQEQATVRIIEGDPDKPLDHEDNIILTEFSVPFDPPRPVDEAGFELTYNYDTDGILTVEARDLKTGKPLGDKIHVAFKGAQDPRQLVGMASNVKDLMADGTGPTPLSDTPEHTTLDPETQLLIERARTKVIPFVEDEEADGFRSMVDAILDASPEDLAAARDALGDRLANYSYLF